MNRTRRLLLVGIGVLVVVALIFDGDDSESPDTNIVPTSPAPSTATFVVPEVFQNIDGWVATENDCSNLQSWFDMADNAHGNQSQLDAMRWLSSLMSRIDARMETAGCYG